jgi:cytoskeletal protein RodZ
MSETLGEKLRQAREERGYTVAEVSENTRISPLYLESIENNDYSNLPGGIFNKGFVKSYAKFVGINEQEALFEYSRLISSSEGGDNGELKRYKPEVLTDDYSSRSMIPTIVIALLILGVMTAAILFGVKYLRQPETAGSITPVATNSNTAVSNPEPGTDVGRASAPDMQSLSVEFKALGQTVSLTSTVDGERSTTTELKPDSSTSFSPKSSLKLRYSRSLASFVQLTINGKPIALPAAPLEPKRSVIEFEINSENLGPIWENGAISTSVPAAAVDANSSIVTEPNAGIRSTPQPKATVGNSPAASPSPKASAAPKPAANVTRPAANRGQ